MVYNTRGPRGSDQKLVIQAILYSFYREKQKVEWLSKINRKSEIKNVSMIVAFLYRNDIELLQNRTFEQSPGDP